MLGGSILSAWSDVGAVESGWLRIARIATQAGSESRRPLGEILVGQDAVEPGDILDVLEIQNQSRSSQLASNIRVDVGQLDKL